MIRILHFEDSKSVAGTMLFLVAAAEKTSGLRVSCEACYATGTGAVEPDALVEAVKADGADDLIRIKVVDYQLYERNPSVQRLVDDVDLVGFDISMGRIHDWVSEDARGRSKRFPECIGREECTCGLNEIRVFVNSTEELEVSDAVEQRLLPADKLFFLVDDRHEREIYDREGGARLYGVRGYMKDHCDERHVEHLAERIARLAEAARDPLREFRSTDYALRLSATWNFGGPNNSSHEYNEQTMCADGRDLAAGLQSDKGTAEYGLELRRSAVQDCASSFDATLEWLKGVNSDGILDPEIARMTSLRDAFARMASEICGNGGATPLDRRDVDDILNSPEFLIGIGYPNGKWNRIDLPERENVVRYRDRFYRLYLKDLAAELRSHVKTEANREVRVPKRGREVLGADDNWIPRNTGAEVFVPRQELLSVLKKLSGDVARTAGVSGLRTCIWSAMRDVDRVTYARNFFALSWRHEDPGNWRGCDHLFEVTEFKHLVEERLWTGFLFDLWLAWKPIGGNVQVHDAGYLATHRREGVPESTTWHEASVKNLGKPLGAWGVPLRTDFMSDEDGEPNISLIFGLSSSEIRKHGG